MITMSRFDQIILARALRKSGLAVALLALALTAGIAAANDDDGNIRLPLDSSTSRLHLGSIDSFDKTPGGIQAARCLLEALEKGRTEAAREALDIYARITPKENFGGEYTALAYFCEYLVADPATRAKMLEDRYVASFFHFFADNDFATLREYLKRKYKIAQIGDEGTPKANRRAGFLEDFILFNNPRRERWEKSSRMIAALALKPGDTVADVGCGPGYFTFKFAELVGPQGRVYAIDTNELHNQYVTALAKKLNFTNIQSVKGRFDGIQVDAKVDCAFMCSLYHIIYATSSESQKDAFIGSIKRALKKDGRFVVVDNGMVENLTLPYHGPYIARELIIGQLRHYGFRLVATHQFIPQRYMLVFQLDPHPVPPSAAPLRSTPGGIEITSKASLIHIPLDAVPDVTVGGRQAARVFLQAIQTRDPRTAEKAAAMYRELVPKEKFGDEYTAFLWFCEFLLQPKARQDALARQKYLGEYVDYLAGKDFAVLKDYLKDRYRLDKDEEILGPPEAEIDADYRPHVTRDQMAFWRDFVLFNNPYREKWEQTSRIVNLLKIRPGQTVADLGCGPGYYTMKFAELVGEQGHVFAVDTNPAHLEYVRDLARKYAANVEPVEGRLNDAMLPAASCDTVVLCSLYGVIYTTSMEMVKDRFVESIRRALKPGGRLVIVDNAVVAPGEIPYHGPFIAKEFVIAQLEHYGFRLVDSAQFIPQRYVLVFAVK